MIPEEFGSDSGNQDAVIAQMAALARGDLSREDVVSSLRRDGHDALDVIVSILDRAIKQSRAATGAAQPLAPSRHSRAEQRPGGKHGVPLRQGLLTRLARRPG